MQNKKIEVVGFIPEFTCIVANENLVGIVEKEHKSIIQTPEKDGQTNRRERRKNKRK